MSDAVKIMFFCLGVGDNVVQIAKQKPRLFRVSLIINAKKKLGATWIPKETLKNSYFVYSVVNT